MYRLSISPSIPEILALKVHASKNEQTNARTLGKHNATGHYVAVGGDIKMTHRLLPKNVHTNFHCSCLLIFKLEDDTAQRDRQTKPLMWTTRMAECNKTHYIHAGMLSVLQRLISLQLGKLL